MTTEDIKKHLNGLLAALANAEIKRHKKVKDGKGQVIRSFSFGGTGFAAAVVTDQDDKIVLHTVIREDLDPDDAETLKDIVPTPKIKPIKVRPASPPPPTEVPKRAVSDLLSDFYFAWDSDPEEGGEDFVDGGFFGIIRKGPWDTEKRWEDDDDAVHLIPDDAPIGQEMEDVWSVKPGATASEARQWLLDNGAVENIDILNWKSYQDGSAPKYDATRMWDALDKTGTDAPEKIAAPDAAKGPMGAFYFARNLESGCFGGQEESDAVVFIRKTDWDATRQWVGPEPAEQEVSGLPVIPFFRHVWIWEPGFDWPEIKSILESAGAEHNTALRSGCHPLEKADCISGHPFPHVYVSSDPEVQAAVQVVDALVAIGSEGSRQASLLTEEERGEVEDEENCKELEIEAAEQLLFDDPDKFLSWLSAGAALDPAQGKKAVAALDEMSNDPGTWETFSTEWASCAAPHIDAGRKEAIRTVLIHCLAVWMFDEQTKG